MALRNYSSTAQRTTLTGSMTNVATTVTVAATTGFPTVPFIGIIDPDTVNEEVVLVTNVATLTLTMTRGYDSTSAVAHNSGVPFQHGFAAIDFREPNAVLNGTGTAILTSPYLTAPEEKTNIQASAIATPCNFDVLSGQTLYYTTASTAGAITLNIRGNGSTALSTLIGTDGDTLTCSLIIATGASTPAYIGTVQIDGTTSGVTTKWQYGTAPSAGNASATDGYTFTIINTAAGYTVFASFAKAGT
jgi:hypothetical protein